MLRFLLSAMVPCFAIGITGLLVTSIGRLLLSLTGDGPVWVALGLTIGIMVGCTVAAALSSRVEQRPRAS